MTDQKIIEREAVTDDVPATTIETTYVSSTPHHGDEMVGGALTGGVAGAAVGAVVGGPVGAARGCANRRDPSTVGLPITDDWGGRGHANQGEGSRAQMFTTRSPIAARNPPRP